MSARDLDFEEVSLLRERSAMLKDGYKTYLQSHPELTQLLGGLVSSCLVHRPEDVFDHAASHFGGKRVDTVGVMLKGLRSFKAALDSEAASQSFDLAAVIKHAFYTYDENHNGTLELDEWHAFVSEVGEGHSLSFQQAETDAMHQWICGELDGHMTSAQLLHAMSWLGAPEGVFAPLPAAEAKDDEPSAVQAGTPRADAEAPAEEPAPAEAAKAPRIIIAGAPASGKGTQCERLVEKYGIKHISTGDLLRAAVVAETDLGKNAKGHMEKGELVPDELLIPLVAEGLTGVTEGWLLDGFPRTQVQAQALKDAGILPDVLLVLDVPDEELTGRCVNRRMDPVSGKIYHLETNPPENDEVAARLVQRGDDTAEKIQTRLKLYHENKDAVCAVFADQVRRVDGNRAADEVSTAIGRIVDTGADAEMDASAAKIQATFRGKQTRKTMAKPAPRQFGSELEKWAAFKAALEKEAAAGGYELSVLMRHVFFSFDADNNGTLETNEWFTFLNDVGSSYRLVFTQEESDSFHSFISGGVANMSIDHFQAGMPKIASSDAPAEEPAPAEAAKAPRIIIAGAPASGKGTQCERLVEKYGIKHISTGDLLRAAVVAETDLGKNAKGHMEKGELVPDELLIPLVAEGLTGVTEGWLLDGFPRTQVQAQALKDAGILPDVLLVLDVPDEELTGRCVNRRMDPVSGKIYHLETNPPENDEVAARLVQRGDDTAEKIQTRLKLYHENKDAVCAVFADQVRRVDGNRAADEVSTAIGRIVDTGADAEMDASAAKIQATFRGKQTRKTMQGRAAEPDVAPVFGVLLVGAPASGKGAQSGLIANEYGLKRLNTGDVVRTAISADTDLGKQAKELTDGGKELPDELLVKLVVDAIKASTSGCAAATITPFALSAACLLR